MSDLQHLKLRELYTHAWHANPTELDLTLSQLVGVLPHLLSSGGAGLVWPRIRHRADEYGAIGEMLEHTYQTYAGNLVSIEAEIALIVSRLTNADIEGVLVKGWSVASLYPAPTVRRPGDIDLVVPPGSFDEAQRIVQRAYGEDLRTNVDLYSDATWRSNPAADFREHIVLKPCSGGTVATLSPEDSLRAVATHFVRHLANVQPGTTPLWLCDICTLAEYYAGELDWNRVFQDEDPAASAVGLALALGRDILGLDPSALPPEFIGDTLPTWATEAVVHRWEHPVQTIKRDIQQVGYLGALQRLWPDPLNASLRCHAPIDDSPRFPYQLRIAAWRVGYYARRLVQRTSR